MDTILLVLFVFIALALIGLVLLQQGKGADVGAAFGSGASQTVFGSRGSGSFLTRATAILATLFFITSLALAYLSGQSVRSESVIDRNSVMQEGAAAPDVQNGTGKADVPQAPQETNGTSPNP